MTSILTNHIRTALLVLGAYAVAMVYAAVLYAPSDDTFIYLVYAKNFLEGNGLTYNGMKVQGFTSLLWTWLIVLVGKSGIDPPRAANGLSAAAGLLAFATTWRLAVRMGLGRLQALTAIALVATAGDFAFYMGNGLESVFFTGMLTWSVTFLCWQDASAALRSWRLPFVLATTVLARPEGAVVAAFILAVLALDSKKPRLLLRAMVIMVAAILPFPAWSQYYYGSWIPNTYYAKAGAAFANTDQGLRYTGYFLLANLLVVVALLYPLIMRRRVADRTARRLYAVVALWITVVTVQGGDNMVGARALLPAMPTMFTLAVYMFRTLDVRRLLFATFVVCAVQVVVYGGGFAVGSSWSYGVRFHANAWRKAFAERKVVAAHLKESLPPNALIAVNAAGTIPYYTGLPTIDMLGLNNKYIARHGRRDRSLPYGHQCGDGRYVLSRKPLAIMLGGTGTIHGEVFLGDREIEASPEFRRNYELRRLPHGYIYIRRP